MEQLWRTSHHEGEARLTSIYMLRTLTSLTQA